MNIPLQVHSGEPVSDDYFIEVWNEPNCGTGYRPQGGYWLSEYTPNEDYPSPWLKFIYDDPEMVDYHSRPYYCIYKIKMDAKIYTINNYADFIKLILGYPIRSDENIYIDFEKVAKDWDGLYLSGEGFEACKTPCLKTLERLGFKGKNSPTLKGWGVPSFLVTNPKILILIEEKENNGYIEV